jgi:hypothetical protein
MGVKYSKYDSMNLFELRDVLFLDSQSKSKGYMAMYNAVNDLLTLSVSKGKYFDEEGNGMTKDFSDATRDYVTAELDGFLGAFRVFASTEARLERKDENG